MSPARIISSAGGATLVISPSDVPLGRRMAINVRPKRARRCRSRNVYPAHSAGAGNSTIEKSRDNST